MRRMIPQKLIDFIKKLFHGIADLVVNTLTSKGIDNTGTLGNIGDAVITGDLYVQSDTEENGNLDVERNATIGGDVEVGGVIRATEVKEEGDTQLIDLTSYIDTQFAKSNSLYAKLLVKHGMLHIVVSGKFVAGASASSSPSILSNFYSALPESIRNKIYRSDGTTIDDAPTSSDTINRFIASSFVMKRVGTSYTSSMAFMQSSASENLTIWGAGFGTITEDAECLVDIRFALTI